jgi:diketogulonate reductase-like aldo/keto reductase
MHQTAMKTTQLGRAVLRRDSILREAEGSLRRLGVDAIDPILTGGNLELTHGDIAEIEGSTP